MDRGRYLTDSWKITIKNIGTMVVATIVLVALSALTLGILTGPLWAGMILMYVRASRGKAVKFPEMFNCMYRILPMLGAGLLICILVTVGLVLLIVPGLLVASWMLFAIPLMADKEMGIMEAMRASKSAVGKVGVWMNLLLILVTAVIVSLGGAVAGLGALIAVPVSVGMVAMAYKDISKA